ncbi:MAG: dTDP-4-dehydrorhamnose 3,5-epimerase [Calditrichales bacterium]|nr:MAG: dTDP-4-dehydrorhamnose 3,5-epimerase [Calditrichales bacterium]
MEIESVHLGSVAVIKHEYFEDQRGFFVEEFRADLYRQLGLPTQFVQENHSGSIKNVVRGLHFQWEPEMSKLMRVLSGTAFLMAVDIRKGSPTLGEWFGRSVTAKERRYIWAPPGFARGFAVLSDYAEIQYLCTGIYNPKGESGIRWNDPEIGIEWPVDQPILSEKDEKAQTLEEWLSRKESDNFKYIASEQLG